MTWYTKKRSERRDWIAGFLRKRSIGLCLAIEFDQVFPFIFPLDVLVWGTSTASLRAAHG
jgi:hypothetical protein